MKDELKKQNNLMAKVLKTTNHNLASAYDLVIADLFHSLKKLKNKGSIKLGNLGTFNKKERILRSALNGRTYVYYQVSFKTSSTLKKELDK